MAAVTIPVDERLINMAEEIRREWDAVGDLRAEWPVTAILAGALSSGMFTEWSRARSTAAKLQAGAVLDLADVERERMEGGI